MKLLDLMISENIEWPVGAGFAEQVKSGMVVFYRGVVNSGQPIMRVKQTASIKKASDWANTIITREQYEEALSTPKAHQKKTLEQLVQEAADLKVSARRCTEQAMADVTSYNKIMSEINERLSGTGWVITPPKGDE